MLLTACSTSQQVVETTSVQVGGVPLEVLIADTPEERQLGLTGVEVIPGGADGMLFVYETPAPVRYFMLDVPIALDIWFFDPDGVLIGGTEMAPCPAEPCPLYPSPADVSWVLETVAGVYEFDEGAALTGAPNGESD